MEYKGTILEAVRAFKEMTGENWDIMENTSTKKGVKIFKLRCPKEDKIYFIGTYQEWVKLYGNNIKN